MNWSQGSIPWLSARQSGYIVNQVDGRAWNSEAVGSNPTTLTRGFMANKKQGNLTPSPQWWKHLKDWKRVFWKTERQAQNKDIKKNLD